MIILGIDPGTALVGYGLIEVKPPVITCLHYGAYAPPRLNHQERLGAIHDFFSKLLKKYRPDQAGLEQLFFFKNAKTFTQVSEARGVLLLTLHQAGIPTHQPTPLQVKQAVSTYGRADKTQVQKMVSLLLNLEKPPRPDDAADALAVAICCANSNSFSI